MYIRNMESTDDVERNVELCPPSPQTTFYSQRMKGGSLPHSFGYALDLLQVSLSRGNKKGRRDRLVKLDRILIVS